MPELPEVETVRRQLETHVLGREIARVEAAVTKIIDFDEDFAHSLEGLSFARVGRVGKLLVFATSDPETFLLAHLKMTGKFLFYEKSEWAPEKRDKHAHVAFFFSDGAVLLFRDVRKFGYVKRATPSEVERVEAGYGIEPLTEGFTFESFEKIFRNRKVTLKALLLDQKAIAGLGNIYVDEICFRAGVRPSRRANTITTLEKERLFDATEAVIREAIDYGGTTFIDFAHTDGQSGSYVDRLQVFAREGEECFVCGSEIKKTRVAGRGTHYCPACQR